MNKKEEVDLLNFINTYSSSSLSICDEMKELSAKVYDFISNVKSVQEESITEYLIWQWKKIHSKKSFLKHYKLHTKYEESTSGADFELEVWIVKKRSYLPFLIQAKKIIYNTNSYCKKSLNMNA